jgi:hypothetical protein
MNIFRTKLAAAAIAISLAGCASIAVTDGALQHATSFAFGAAAAPGTFQITNRQDSGLKTSFDVKLADGRQFACYVTGTVAITGRAVSDAVCRPANKLAEAKPAPGSCNAMLKAAGNC